MTNTSYGSATETKHISLCDDDIWTTTDDHTDSHCRSGRARAQSPKSTGWGKSRTRWRSKSQRGGSGTNPNTGSKHKSKEGLRVHSASTAGHQRQRRSSRSSLMDANRDYDQQNGYWSESSDYDLDYDLAAKVSREKVRSRARSPRPVFRCRSHEPVRAPKSQPRARERTPRSSPRPRAKPRSMYIVQESWAPRR